MINWLFWELQNATNMLIDAANVGNNHAPPESRSGRRINAPRRSQIGGSIIDIHNWHTQLPIVPKSD